MTEVVHAGMSLDDARRLTERIRLTAHTARESIEKLHALLAQAKEGNVAAALEYPSWTAYLSDVLGSEPLRLARDQRQELVGFLAGEGMSTRAIAPIVGVDKDTVRRDLKSGGVNTPPPTEPEPRDEFDGSDWIEPTEVDEDEVIEAEIVEDKVTGLDGKTYARNRPAPPPKYGPRRKHSKIIENITVSLSGLATAADEIQELDDSITPDEAARLSSELTKSLASLRRINNLLTKETSR